MELLRSWRWRVKVLFRHVCSLRLVAQAWKDFREIGAVARQGGSDVVALTEHIGDIAACEPVARYLAEEKKRKVIWVVNRKFAALLAYHPAVDRVVQVSCLSEWIYLKYMLLHFSRIPVYDMHIHGRKCARYGLWLGNKQRKDITFGNYYRYGPLLTVFSQVAGLPALHMPPCLYLPEPLPDVKRFRLPEKYIVVQTTSNEEKRNWDLRKWEELIGLFPGYVFVEAGMKPTLRESDRCLTVCCGKTTLPEVAVIIRNAFLFIGIDSAFAHFANALGTPALILLGRYNEFDSYMPYTGNFENPKVATVIHHRAPVRLLPVEEAAAELEKLIRRLEARTEV